MSAPTEPGDEGTRRTPPLNSAALSESSAPFRLSRASASRAFCASLLVLLERLSFGVPAFGLACAFERVLELDAVDFAALADGAR